MSSVWKIGDRHALKLSRSATSGFFATMNGVAKHFGHHFRPTQKMDLKTMRLFSGSRFRIDALDVRFRIRIGSFSHEFFLVTQTLR